MTVSISAPSAVPQSTSNVSGIAADELSEFVARLFIAAGVSQQSARSVADGLVDADLEGLQSHGVMLVDMYIDRLLQGSVSRNEAATVVSERQAAVVLDAGHAFGQITGAQAMSIAIDKARQFAAGVVPVRHGFHFGTGRKYALQAANAGFIGIAMCNTRPLMPAPGGAERMVGNNPIAIALPTDGTIPLVLDMATSEAAMGKIRMAEKAKETIPPTWAVTADGEPTTDPAKAIAGMLLPSGGAKGFGLSFMIDLMCGLLSQGASGPQVKPLYGDMSVPYDCSHLFIAIDVSHFCDAAWFSSQSATAAARIRSGQRAPGVERLFSPGEPEWNRRQHSAGQVRIEPAVAESWQMLVAPAGTPASVLDKLNAETNNVVASPAVRDKFLQFGVTPKGTGTLNELLAFNRAEIDRWGAVVRNAGIAGSE